MSKSTISMAIFIGKKSLRSFATAMAWKRMSAAPKASAQAYPAMPAKPVPEDQDARQGWSGGPAEAEDPQWVPYNLW